MIYSVRYAKFKYRKIKSTIYVSAKIQLFANNVQKVMSMQNMKRNVKSREIYKLLVVVKA